MENCKGMDADNEIEITEKYKKRLSYIFGEQTLSEGEKMFIRYTFLVRGYSQTFVLMILDNGDCHCRMQLGVSQHKKEYFNLFFQSNLSESLMLKIEELRSNLEYACSIPVQIPPDSTLHEDYYWVYKHEAASGQIFSHDIPVDYHNAHIINEKYQAKFDVLTAEMDAYRMVIQKKLEALIEVNKDFKEFTFQHTDRYH